MEAENRPSAALINREWFESAKSVLSADGLGRLLVAACNYVILGELPPMMSGNEGVVFAMIRPALDSDILKYRERCARNAANAKSGRQRVAASGTQSQQVGATSTPTSTPTSTTTPTSTPSLSDGERRDRERFEIYGYFWSVGSNDPKAELDAFWDYYEALGWKNNKGAVIVSKLAAARMWRRQFETKTTPDGALQWFKAVKECAIPNPKVFTAFMGMEREGEHVVIHLSCSEKFFAQIRENTPRLEPDLRAFLRGIELIFDTAG